MKKLLIGFLAVGLIMAFAMTASAQPNVKASGQLYMYGSYADNMYLTKDANARANIANRLRMQFEIQVQEGLKLTTRFDALERVWGENQVVGGSQTGERNIAWERAYVTFNALYGVFDVGYQQSRAWGTCAFCDDSWSDSGIHYRYMMGPWTLGLEFEKRGGWNEMKDVDLNSQTITIGEGSRQSSGSGLRTLNTLGGSDNDHDVYHIYGIYRWATGQAGLRYELERDAANGKVNAGTNLALAPYGNPGATRSDAWVATFHEISPYVQGKFGPFDFEGEFRYIFGKVEYDNSNLVAVDRKGWDLYLMGKYTAGAFYGGLEFAYISGDDPNTTDKSEAGQTGGSSWNPLLMFGNYWFLKYQGALGNPTYLSNQASSATRTDANTFTVGEYETNLVMFKPFVGWKVNPQLEIVAQFAWLKAQEKPRVGGVPGGAQFISDDYGREFDVYANYNIYKNLTYTVGFGYFWTGDYFKGATANAQLEDNWMAMNALNLAF